MTTPDPNESEAAGALQQLLLQRGGAIHADASAVAADSHSLRAMMSAAQQHRKSAAHFAGASSLWNLLSARVAAAGAHSLAAGAGDPANSGAAAQPGVSGSAADPRLSSAIEKLTQILESAPGLKVIKYGG